MATSVIESSRIKQIKHDIPNDASNHAYRYPGSYRAKNCVLVGAKVETTSDTFIDMSVGGNYWGAFTYGNDTSQYFNFAATAAGYIKSIEFMFYIYEPSA